MGLQIPCSSIFHAHQRHYICPVVNDYYLEEQVYTQFYLVMCLLELQGKLISEFKDCDLVLAGDGRCGSSAKYCSYSLMDMNPHKILHIETVDKREVKLQSPNMEHKAFVDSIEHISSQLTCSEVVTDASSSIRKTMGTYCIYP